MEACRENSLFGNRILCVAKRTTKPRLLQSFCVLPKLNPTLSTCKPSFLPMNFDTSQSYNTRLLQNIELTIELILCH